jgi:hypothetical protein
MTWTVVGVAQSRAAHPAVIPAQATVKAIEVADSSVGKEILLRIDGHYTFRTIQTPEGKVYIDVQGAKLGTRQLTGYHLIQYTDASGQPVVRIEIPTLSQQPLMAKQEASGLRLHFAPDGQASPSNPTPGARDAMVPGESTKAALLVSDVSVTPESEGGVTIEVATTKSAPFQTLRFDHPDRFVVDLQGARNALHQNSIVVSSPVVKDVRVRQFRGNDPAVVRLVVDLSGNPLVEARAFTGGLRIEVKPRSTAGSGAVATAPAPKLEPGKRQDEAHPIQQAVPAGERSDSARVKVPREPATNRLSRGSNPGASPGSGKTDKPGAENPQAVPVLDDFLRYLFSPDVPSPSNATSPAKQRTPPPVNQPPPINQPSPVNQPEGLTTVSAISVKPGSVGEITIEVALTKPSPFKASRFDRPDRFVVDVEGEANRFSRKSIHVGSLVVKDIRVGQFRQENPKVVRVVVDLSGHPVCDAHAYENGVRIRVKPRGLSTDAGDKTR